MCTIQKNIIINVPPADVWAVLGEAGQWSKLNPNVSDYTYTPCPDGGYEGEWNYTLGKLKLHSKIRTNIYEPMRRLVVESCGQMKSKWIWWIESDGEWTHLALTVEYSAKWSGVGAVLHELVLEYLHGEALNIYLGNIKRKAEKIHAH
ncbi:MAG: hypothetical protein GC179_20605 [Anaerolineaceae bacterium]|nr:hypothetical protein [Anaerolineaceae bacterium]